MTTSRLTAADDSFHPPVGKHPYWTESCYFSFDEPDRKLSLAIYPLFRPNQGICSLAVHLWDDTGTDPWEVPYSRFLWHVPMPTMDLTELEVEGLRITAEKPLQRYHVEYRDGDRLSLDLEFEALREPFVSTTQVPASAFKVGGHYDQAMRVQGQVKLGAERFGIDTFGHRDRSWYDRPDNEPRQSASISFGAATSGDHYLVLRPQALAMAADSRPPAGYLVLDEVARSVTDVKRRVTRRLAGKPREIELEIIDDLGRELQLIGTAVNNLAFLCSPPVFAWFSQIHWSGGGHSFLGEDQEAYGFADIARNIAANPVDGA
jgi:hypothetical protein